MSRRSTGCEKCRIRKVRCDETRPQCRRCRDYGVDCPGYRPPRERDFRFVDLTKRTSGQDQGELGRKSCSDLTYFSSRRIELRQYRWHHVFLQSAARGSPYGIDSRPTHRIQLLDTFLDLHLPKQVDEDTTSHFAYIAKLPDIDLSTPLLQVSVDALCLAEIGSLHNDERCMYEAQARYTRALPLLANELARRPSQQLRKDHVLTVITVLALCELFDVIARVSQSGRGWMNHVEGAHKFIAAHAASALISSLGQQLFHANRHSALCIGLVTRKSVVYADPTWSRLSASIITKADAVTAFYDIAVHVPGLLGRHDRLQRTSASSLEATTLYQDICSVRQTMESWQSTWVWSGGIEVVDVRDMLGFASLCRNSLFTTVFKFSSVQMCILNQLYWVCSLLLDFTSLDIRHIKSATDGQADTTFLDSRTNNEVERGMLVAATNLCRAVPYCYEPAVASVGRIGPLLLHIVQDYFERRGHCAEVEWCRSVNGTLDTPHDEQPRPEPGHRCNSARCNFVIRCCAPAPPLLDPENHPSPIQLLP